MFCLNRPCKWLTFGKKSLLSWHTYQGFLWVAVESSNIQNLCVIIPQKSTLTTKCCFILFVLHEFEIETKNVEIPLFRFNHRLSLSFRVKYLTSLCLSLWKYKFMRNSYHDLPDPKRKWFKNIISFSNGFILNKNFPRGLFITQLWFRTFERALQSPFHSLTTR